MAVRPILLLGDPRLYETSSAIARAELPELRDAIADLHETMQDFQARHGWGRAIAMPQIGVPRRIVAMHVTAPLTMINPVLDQHSEDQVEHWEDCMSFPELVVRLRNARTCRLKYRDLDWAEHEVHLEGDFAELLQHEVDHLNGVLAVQRAIDDRSIALRRQRPEKDLTLHGSFEPIR